MVAVWQLAGVVGAGDDTHVLDAPAGGLDPAMELSGDYFYFRVVDR